MSATNLRLKDGAVQLTMSDKPGDGALLTVRGKDHSLDDDDLVALANTALQALTGPRRIEVMMHFLGSAKKAVRSVQR